MSTFLIWLVTVVISYSISYATAKFDYHKNEGDSSNELVSEPFLLTMFIVLLFLPIINIVASIIFAIVTIFLYIDNIEGNTAKKIYMKLFMIKDKNEEKKKRARW